MSKKRITDMSLKEVHELIEKRNRRREEQTQMMTLKQVQALAEKWQKSDDHNQKHIATIIDACIEAIEMCWTLGLASSIRRADEVYAEALDDLHVSLFRALWETLPNGWDSLTWYLDDPPPFPGWPGLDEQIERLSLNQYAKLANILGAEGVFLIHNAQSPRLIYSLSEDKIDHKDNAILSHSALLEIADPETLLVIRFPVGDGGDGVESL